MSGFLAHSLLLLVAFIWGVTFVFQTTGMETLGPFSFTWARFMFGSIALLPFALMESRQVSLFRQCRASRKICWLALGLGLAMFCGSALQQISLGITSVANAAFFTTLYVPLVPLLGLFLFRRQPGMLIWLAVAVFVLGSWLMSGASPRSARLGDLLVIIGAVFWAFHIMIVGRLGRLSQAPIQMAFVQTVMTAFFALPLMLALEQPKFADFTPALPELLIAGVLSTALAFGLQLFAQRYSSNAAAALLLSLEGVFAALAAWLLIDQMMTVIAVIGAGLIVGAVLMVEWESIHRTSSGE